MTDPTPERFYEIEAWANQQAVEIERLRTEKEMFRKAADADGFHRVLAARDAEIERLRGEIIVCRADRENLHQRVRELLTQLATEKEITANLVWAVEHGEKKA